jgi:DNA-binding PadR family transcriptional regulator
MSRSRNGVQPQPVGFAWIGGLVRGFFALDVLRQAGQQPIYGTGVTRTLAERGYWLPKAKVYPILKSLEAAELLERSDCVIDGKRRKCYRATTRGRQALARARRQVIELRDELITG